MNASMSSRAMLLGAAAALALTVSIAAAQTAPDSKSPAPAGKGQAGEKTAKPAAAKPAGWATESEARAHCRGTIVWVDKDHFNHYAGSREYGRKPGAFACES